MAGWSIFSNGSTLDCHRVESVDGNNGDVVNDQVDNADHDNVKPKTLFYKLFPVYLKESCSGDIVRSLPVMVGDGQLVDLYKLFSLVKEIGGCAEVSREGLWGYVTEQLGLDHQLLASVKLVHDKYLKDFDEWLRKAFEEKNIKSGNHGFKSFPLEHEKEFRDLLYINLIEKDNGLVELESNRLRKYVDLDNHRGEPNLLDTRKKNTSEDVQNVHDDDDENACNGVKDDLSTLGAEAAENGFGSRKRKREPLSGMLNWIRQIAKHPLVPQKQPLPKPSKWKEYKGQDFFIQLVRAREVLSLGPCVQPNSEASSSQKLKMHPAMYEDHVAPRHHSTVKLRCSERLPTSVKSRSCACCNSGSAKENRLTNSVNTEAKNCPLDKTTPTVELPPAKMMTDQSVDDFHAKPVSVGPLFQAEVPQWTGEASESDPKWLGTQVWPPKHDLKLPTETDIVGRGREEKCSCNVKGSVECVRFHIAESRMRLRRELGSAFFHWGFGRMGEEISLQWTTEEERWFKDLMMLNIPSNNKSFWSNSSKYFPEKTRRNLVSYYFNVYLIQLRSYQSRATPWNIDSDKDEEEFGSFGEGFGMEAIKAPGSNFLQCSVNKQFTDLE